MAMTTEKVWAALDSLLRYAKDCELLHPLDETFARNSLLAELKLESYEKQKEHYEFPECLNVLCDYAAENGQINDTIAERDLFDTRLMGCVTGIRPNSFWGCWRMRAGCFLTAKASAQASLRRNFHGRWYKRRTLLSQIRKNTSNRVCKMAGCVL